jgi:chaperonin GroES
MKINPLHNHVVIKRKDETEMMYGKIIIPDLGNDKVIIGEVIASGPGIINMNGILIPNNIEVGQMVVMPSFGGQKITLENEDYLVYKEQDLIATLEN